VGSVFLAKPQPDPIRTINRHKINRIITHYYMRNRTPGEKVRLQNGTKY